MTFSNPIRDVRFSSKIAGLDIEIMPIESLFRRYPPAFLEHVERLLFI
jgi:hypothetical protein